MGMIRKFSVICALIALSSAACTSEAPHELDIPDASDMDAQLEDVLDPPDVLVPPVELSCKAVLECSFKCADAECRDACAQSASEVAASDLNAFNACWQAANCLTDAGYEDMRCVYEACASQGGSCTAREPENALSCLELSHCIFNCEEDDTCVSACVSQASTAALFLRSAMMACPEEPETSAACEGAADVGQCINEVCAPSIDACNAHVVGSENDGLSCDGIAMCLGECPYGYACFLICMEEGSAEGRAQTLLAVDEYNQCLTAGRAACETEQGADWACLDEKWASCSIACP
jgi:hypothetical protein